MRGINFRNAAGPIAPAEPTAEQKAAIEKMQTQHSDLMYANAALLKTVKWVALSFGAITLALIGYSIYTGRASKAPALAAPAPPMALPPIA